MNIIPSLPQSNYHSFGQIKYNQAEIMLSDGKYFLVIAYYHALNTSQPKLMLIWKGKKRLSCVYTRKISHMTQNNKTETEDSKVQRRKGLYSLHHETNALY